jgi:hypothetical protein
MSRLSHDGRAGEPGFCSAASRVSRASRSHGCPGECGAVCWAVVGGPSSAFHVGCDAPGAAPEACRPWRRILCRLATKLSMKDSSLTASSLIGVGILAVALMPKSRFGKAVSSLSPINPMSVRPTRSAKGRNDYSTFIPLLHCNASRYPSAGICLENGSGVGARP